jgi:hypothetical protein
MVKAWCVVVVGALVGASFGCGEDEPSGGGAGGTSGAGGSAGSGGSSGGGTAGSGGSSGAGAGGGGAGAAGGPASGLVLVAGTDYSTKTEIAALELGTGKPSGSATVNDGDAVPAASGGRGFVLQRGSDVVLSLGPDGSIDKTISLGGAGGGSAANPTGIAAVGTTAYVTLYNASKIAVLDLAQGVVKKTIDLAHYLDAGAGDDSVEVSTPIHDPSSGRIYATLARIDLTTGWQLACSSAPALMVAFDAASGEPVDLNGAAAGNAVELLLMNPTDVAFDAEKSRLLVLAAGCFAPIDGGTARTGHGIEAFDLASSTPSVLLVPTDASFFSRILYLGADQALVNRFDESYGEHWNRWTTSDPALGAELSGVPAAPAYDGKGALLGVQFDAADGGTSASVVRYDLTSETTKSFAAEPWQESFSFSSGTAVVTP